MVGEASPNDPKSNMFSELLEDVTYIPDPSNQLGNQLSQNKEDKDNLRIGKY